jgi:hypothetical protein
MSPEADRERPPVVPPPGAVAEAKPGRAAPRSRWRRAALIAAVVLASLALLITFAPQPVASLLLHHYSRELGIELEGEKTLDVNLWRGRIGFGPARFRVGDADHGQIARMSLDINLPSLLQQRARVTTLVITGLNLKLDHSADGGLRLNGVALRDFMPQATEQQAARDAASVWDTGIDSFELVDSQLTYVGRREAATTLAIERLDLIGFRSWQPDQPGSFALTGNVNGIAIEAKGEAAPFADKINTRLRYAVHQIELGRLPALAGGLPLERRSGQLDLSGAGELAIDTEGAAAGSIDGAVSGEFAARSIDASIKDAAALTLQSGSGRYELRAGSDAEGDLRVAGSLGLDASNGHVQLADQVDLRFERILLPPTDLAVALSAAGGVEASARPQLQLSGVTASGGAQLAATSVKLQLDELALRRDRDADSVAGSLKGSAQATALRVTSVAQGSHTGLDIALESGSAALDQVQISGRPSDARITGQLAATLTGLSGETDVVGNGGREKLTLALRSAKANSSDLALHLTSAGIAGGGPLTVEIDGGRVSIAPYGRARRGTSSSLDFERAAVDLASTQLTPGDGAFKLQGNLEVTGVHAVASQVEVRPDARLARLRLTTDGLSLRVDGERLAMAGSLRAMLSQLRASLSEAGASPAPTDTGFDELTLDLPALEVVTAAAGQAATGNGTLSIRKVSFDRPAGGDLPRTFLGIEQGTVPMRSFRLRNDGRRTTLEVLNDLVLSGVGFGSANPGGVVKVGMAELQIRDGRLDENLNLHGDRIAIERLGAEISRRWIEALSERERQEIRETAEEVAREVSSLRVAALEVGRDSTIRLIDDTVEPPVRMQVDVNSMLLYDVNTRDPQQRTRLAIDTQLNEFGRIQASGWATPLAPEPDFDLALDLTRLELPPFSPYTAKAIGFNFDSGRVRADGRLSALKGQLNGVLDIRIRNLEFAPVSQDAASAFASTTSVPLQTVVDLLKDSDGRIRLLLPVSGNLRSPTFDPSDAVRQAVGSAIKSAVLAPLELAFLPFRALTQAADQPKEIHLDPIPFEPGDAKLNAEARALVADLAAGLRQNPDVVVRVCGRATFRDAAAHVSERDLLGSGRAVADMAPTVRQRMERLAMERTFAVRRSLIEDEQISGRRVLECRSVADPDDNGLPRTEVLS